MVNQDDTRRCPVGPECEGCGRLEELAQGGLLIRGCPPLWGKRTAAGRQRGSGGTKRRVR
jgi:hypothetical protein